MRRLFIRVLPTGTLPAEVTVPGGHRLHIAFDDLAITI
jgi:hypothetical protein